MSRKLPSCAYCGEPLAKQRSRGRILFEFTDAPGNPAIGWHTRSRTHPHCDQKDRAMVEMAFEDFHALADKSKPIFPGSVYNVWKRGGDRVSVMNDARFTEVIDNLLAAEGETGAARWQGQL